jgi:hypothetical protein
MDTHDENSNFFICQICDFKCSKNSNYQDHLNTSKHKKYTALKDAGLEVKEPTCLNCGKVYKHMSGLWRHRKTCVETSTNNLATTTAIATSTSTVVKGGGEEIDMLTQLVREVVKSNGELQKQMSELCHRFQTTVPAAAAAPPITAVAPTINNNFTQNNTNSHNKTFNLHFFLNEECKDAMNLVDFVDSVTLQLSDLENVGRLGYVAGISNIMLQRLKELDVRKRPIHCSDAKRETLHVKDDNKWEKEGLEKRRIRQAIKTISKKNSRLLVEWNRTHLPYQNNSHDNSNNDIYMNLIKQALATTMDNEDKIIKRIAKSMIIVKQKYPT